MPDTVTEVTSQSWFGRIGNSIKNILFGIILFIASFVLLFWNEGRAVRDIKTFDEGLKAVIMVKSEAVEKTNDGKLVCMNGTAVSGETLSDPQFGISAKAIKLSRLVEMYQWKEETENETQKKVGGGSETVTTYTYNKEWSNELIDSNSFKKPSGHTNPGSKEYEDKDLIAHKVSLGAFTLSEGLVCQLDKFEDVTVTDENLQHLSPSMKEQFKISQGMFYKGSDLANPAIGDLRVSFSVVNDGPATIVAKQIGSTFEPYLSKVGGKIEMLENGTYSANNVPKEWYYIRQH